MMKTKFLSLFLILFVIQITFSQYKQLSEKAEISIITAGPGKVLYERFGHSAIRVKSADFDLIYNYGFFDFNAPNFYLNFAKGKMLYKLERYPFHYFVRSSQRDKRWIKEQILNLNQSEKQQFFEYLENNAKPENASYLYDPFFNNCATVLVDITKSVLGDKVSFNDISIEKSTTLRTLMNKEIYWNTWGSFGINLIAGTILDKKPTNSEYMYLPDYLYKGFESATVKVNTKSDKLVKKESVLLNYEEHQLKSEIFNPLLIFSLFSLLGIFITFKDIKKNKRTKTLDFILFLITGIIGCCITFLWFFSSHSTAPNNFNFLWAFAPNVIVAFYVLKENSRLWIKTYVKILMILLLIIPVLWIEKIQLLPTAVLPFIALLFVRFLALDKYLLSSKK